MVKRVLGETCAGREEPYGARGPNKRRVRAYMGRCSHTTRREGPRPPGRAASRRGSAGCEAERTRTLTGDAAREGTKLSLVVA